MSYQQVINKLSTDFQQIFNSKSNKQKPYKNEAAIPVQFHTNENGETCFRETSQGDYKIGRDGRVIRRR